MQTNKIVKGPGVRCSCLARAVCCVLRCRAIRCRGAHLLMRMTFVKSQQVVDAVAQRHGAASKRCPITKSRGVPWAGSKLPSMMKLLQASVSLPVRKRMRLRNQEAQAATHLEGPPVSSSPAVGQRGPGSSARPGRDEPRRSRLL